MEAPRCRQPMRNIMKTILLAVGAALALGTSLSAVAGPDWYVIEKARAAK